MNDVQVMGLEFQFLFCVQHFEAFLSISLSHLLHKVWFFLDEFLMNTVHTHEFLPGDDILIL